jgi:hypothetical protein
MSRKIEQPLKLERETKQYLVYGGSADVPHVYIAKSALPRPYPRYITVLITPDGRDGDV